MSGINNLREAGESKEMYRERMRDPKKDPRRGDSFRFSRRLADKKVVVDYEILERVGDLVASREVVRGEFGEEVERGDVSWADTRDWETLMEEYGRDIDVVKKGGVRMVTEQMTLEGLLEVGDDGTTYGNKNFPLLPEGANVKRANGDVTCLVCGIVYREHPRYRYIYTEKTVVRACDGGFDGEVYLHL